jgi:hypothetical protein
MRLHFTNGHWATANKKPKIKKHSEFLTVLCVESSGFIKKIWKNWLPCSFKEPSKQIRDITLIASDTNTVYADFSFAKPL